jgi:hypothetical protein
MNAMDCLSFGHLSSFWLLVLCRRAFRNQIAKIVDENKVKKHSTRETLMFLQRNEGRARCYRCHFCASLLRDIGWNAQAERILAHIFGDPVTYTVSWTGEANDRVAASCSFVNSSKSRC